MEPEVLRHVKRVLCYDRRGPYGREVCEQLVEELVEKGYVCQYDPDAKKRVYRFMVLEKWRRMGILRRRRLPVCGGFGKTRVCYQADKRFIIMLEELAEELMKPLPQCLDTGEQRRRAERW